MPSFDEIREEIISFFLTEFPNDHAIAYVESVVKDYLLLSYAPEWVEDFWEKSGHRVIDDLTKEHTRRIRDNLPIYFRFENSNGTLVRGWINPNARINTAEFQKALLSLSDSEFEFLSACVLRLLGCTKYWATPASHDQGIDAFGHIPLLPGGLPDSVFRRRPLLCWVLVQAKHFNTSKINSETVRSFVGAAVLARHGAYAQESTKYGVLDLKAVTPIGLVITTSGEIKRTARILGQKSDVYSLTTDDLCSIFTTYWKDTEAGVPDFAVDIAKRLKEETRSIPVAT